MLSEAKQQSNDVDNIAEMRTGTAVGFVNEIQTFLISLICFHLSSHACCILMCDNGTRELWRPQTTEMVKISEFHSIEAK